MKILPCFQIICLKSTFRMSSRQVTSGLRPPCTHRNCWLRRAARGRQSKASIQASYTCSEYFILPGRSRQKVKCEVVDVKKGQVRGVERQDSHSCLKVKYSVRCRHSWLPLRRNRVLGWLIFRAHRYSTHFGETKTHTHTVVRNESSALLLHSNAKNLSHGV